MKGKAQYFRAPHQDSLFNKKGNIYFSELKATDLD
jgi:hypothetical protein